MKKYACLNRQDFRSGDYRISPVQPEHIARIRDWRNEQTKILRQSILLTPAQQESYFERHIWPAMELPNPSTILFGFFQRDTLIGYGGLVHVAWEHRRAELSFLLDPQRTVNRDSYANEFSIFLILIKEVAFDHLRLHRIFTETYAFREHHMSVLEGSRFRREGVMRDHVIIDGKLLDSILHGCLESYET